jgi:hypothetical protein
MEELGEQISLKGEKDPNKVFQDKVILRPT